jgi:uncharacterized delta-60 repeat protein
MAKTLQFRRGTTAELSSVTGAEGELFVDTTKDTVVVMDGSTAGGKPLATEAFVGTAVSNLIDSAPGALDTLNELAAALGDDANFATSISNTVATAGSYANSAFAKANTAGAVYTTGSLSVAIPLTIQSNSSVTISAGDGAYPNDPINLNAYSGNVFVRNTGEFPVTGGRLTAGTIRANNWQDYSGNSPDFATKANAAYIHANAAFAAANTSGGVGSADFSSIDEDVLPQFSEVYDIGSANNRWYDGYFSNKVDIGGSEIFGSVDGIVIPNAALVDQVLISDNMITPDDTSVRQYFGDKGVVVVNGNLDVDGDWLGTPVVQTTQEIIGINAGDSDTSFNAGTGFYNQEVKSIAYFNDKLVVVGDIFQYNGDSISSGITRLNVDGTIDTSFDGGSGFTSGSPSQVIIQPDGKILLSGNFNMYNGNYVYYLIRLNADGTIDTSFAVGSGFNDLVVKMALQSDGKILVGGPFTTYNGTSVNEIVRLNSDGSIDNSFALAGSGLNYRPDEIKLQPDGKILVSGEFSQLNGTTVGNLIRLNSDGSLDNSFTIGQGMFSGLNGTVHHLTLQPDGKIIAHGGFNNLNGETQWSPVRFNTDGSKDNSFVTPGSGFNNRVMTSVLQSDGKILVGGYFTNHGGTLNNGTPSNRIARLNSDGSYDTSFIIGSGFNNTVNSIVLQPNGNIIVGGYFMTYDGVANRAMIGLVTNPVLGQPTLFPPIGGEEGFIRYNKDITAFQAYNGTSWELLERVTTPPTELATTGTVDVDFSGATLSKQGNLTGDVTYTGSNYLPGSTVTIRVVNGSTERIVTFPTDWVFVGEVPTTLGANKTAVLTVTSFGTTESDCVAAWAAQA